MSLHHLRMALRRLASTPLPAEAFPPEAVHEMRLVIEAIEGLFPDDDRALEGLQVALAMVEASGRPRIAGRSV